VGECTSLDGGERRSECFSWSGCELAKNSFLTWSRAAQTTFGEKYGDVCNGILSFDGNYSNIDFIHDPANGHSLMFGGRDSACMDASLRLTRSLRN